MKKILVIEDDKLLIKAISAKLKEERFKVIEACDGEDGFNAARDNNPDLVLCDLNMPKMDGLTMLKKMRKTDWGADMAIIVLTNYSEKEKISEALNQYVDRYLIKSDWDIEQIVDEVKKSLNMR